MNDLQKISSVAGGAFCLIGSIVFLVLTYSVAHSNDLDNDLQKIGNELSDSRYLILNSKDDSETCSERLLELVKARNKLDKDKSAFEYELQKLTETESILNSELECCVYLEQQLDRVKLRSRREFKKYFKRMLDDKEAETPPVIKKPDDKTPDKTDNNNPDNKNPKDPNSKDPNLNDPDNSNKKPVLPKKPEKSVLLHRPSYLIKKYTWPLSPKNIVSLKAQVTSFKNKISKNINECVDPKGKINAISTSANPLVHIGKAAMGYAVLKQCKIEDKAKRVLSHIANLCSKDNLKKVMTAELGHILLGIVYSRLEEIQPVKVEWKPQNYKQQKKLNATETKIIRSVIDELNDRQTKTGGWSNFSFDKDELYDYDVYSSSIVLLALSNVRLAGYKGKVTTESLKKGLEFILKLQKKGFKTGRSILLNKEDKLFENVKIRGWGLDEFTNASMRTTVWALAAIGRVVKAFEKEIEDCKKKKKKPDSSLADLISKGKNSLVEGYAYVADYWVFEKDLTMMWGLMLALGSIDGRNIYDRDIYSETVIYLIYNDSFIDVRDYSFYERCISYFISSWVVLEDPTTLKTLIIKGYKTK